MSQREGARRRPPSRTGVGASAVGSVGVVLIGALYVAGAALLLYAIMQFWPTTSSAGTTCTGCNFFGVKFKLQPDRAFLLVVALAGALGALVHGLRSLARYVGEQVMYRSWLLFYAFLPLIGATLGTVVYLVLRAGLISGGGVKSADPFGFAAIAALVGLFSAQAAEKLKQVFETLFTKPEAGSDSVSDLGPPTISGVDPATGSVGSTVTINGTNFEDDSIKVSIGGVAAGIVTVLSDTQVTAVVPTGVTPGDAIVTVTTKEGTVSAPPGTFTVTP